MAFLGIHGLRKTYGAVTALDGIDLEVERGEFVTLLGPSGCGKTTTLRMIAGFETPSAGKISIDSRDVTNLRPNRRNIGMVFQAYALFPNLTVAQNIGFGLKVAGRSAAEIKARGEEMLAMIRLPDLAQRYPYQLSGGQQQRVSLARAVAPSPQIAFFAAFLVGLFGVTPQLMTPFSALVAPKGREGAAVGVKLDKSK